MRRKCLLALLLAGSTFAVPPALAQVEANFWAGGGVRIGDSTTTCNASIEGSIRYNDTTNVHQFCNGTAWADIASGAGGATLNGVTAATGAQAGILNADNAIVWNWATTSAGKDAFTFGESAASTATGESSILKAATLASSTATPLMATNLGAANSFRVNDQTGDNDATPFVVDNAGKVGIAYASPTANLEIADPSGGATMRMRYASFTLASFVMGSGGLDLVVDDGGFSVSTNVGCCGNWSGTQRFAINNNGNIAIGGYAVSPPTYLLSLEGNSARTIGMERHTTSNTAGNSLTVSAGGATSGATNKNGGSLILSGGLATGAGDSDVLIKGYQNASQITLLTLNGDTGNVTAAGNVGIRTASPTAALEINDAAAGNFATLVKIGNGTYTTVINPVQVVSKYGIFDTAIESPLVYGGASAGDITLRANASPTAGNVIIESKPAVEIARFTSTGRLGIGTATPGYPLDVAGNARLDGSNVTLVLGSNGSINGQSNTLYLNATGGVVSTGWGHYFEILDNSGVPQVHLGHTGNQYISGGNLGIGTTSPAATLDVNGYAKLKVNASPPATCDAAHEGSIAYTGTTTHYLCFCDGTGWQQASAPASACAW